MVHKPVSTFQPPPANKVPRNVPHRRRDRSFGDSWPGVGVFPRELRELCRACGPLGPERG